MKIDGSEIIESGIIGEVRAQSFQPNIGLVKEIRALMEKYKINYMWFAWDYWEQVKENAVKAQAKINFKAGDKTGYDRGIAWSVKVGEETLNKVYEAHERELQEVRQAGIKGAISWVKLHHPELSSSDLDAQLKKWGIDENKA